MSTQASELVGLLKSDTAKKEGAAAKKSIQQEELPLIVKAPTLETLADKDSPINLWRHPTLETLASDKDSLENIVATQKQLSQVKATLGSIIDTMAQNPSIINRAARYYGEMASWQKITLGLGLSVPTLVAGLFTHVGFLLLASGVTGFAYTATGIVLDDHHNCNVEIADRLKKGVFSLADVLELTIGALETIRKDLAAEIEKFKTENLKLAKHVVDLGEQLELLGPQIELFKETEKSLFATKNALEETVKQLQDSTTDQTKLLQENQAELAKITKEYRKSQEQLSEKYLELTTVQVTMASEVEKAKKVNATLSGTVTTLSRVVISDTSQREAFQKKLDLLLSEKETGLEKVTERMSDTERDLETVRKDLQAVKTELTSSLESHKVLLKEQAKQVERLKAIPSPLPVVGGGFEVLTEKHGVLKDSGKENILGGMLNRSRFYTGKEATQVSEKHSIVPGQDTQILLN